jgi:DNA mismatch repair protein MutS
MADELPHLSVYTVAISEDEQGNIIFLHRVIPGNAGRSYGVHVARLAGMPANVVRRAEIVLKQLEDGKNAVVQGFSTYSNGDGYGGGSVKNGKRIAEENGHYTTGSQVLTEWKPFEWRSEEARLIAASLEEANGYEGEQALDTIDLNAITPLDALNLLSLLQKKRSRRRQ